jgi:hypothetical protein
MPLTPFVYPGGTQALVRTLVCRELSASVAEHAGFRLCDRLPPSPRTLSASVLKQVNESGHVFVNA